LLAAIKSGDLEEFGKIVEGEALSLHAMMMAAENPFTLLEPNTLEAISRIQAYRADSHIPLYFSLDAGPNPHLLFPEQYSIQVKEFIKNELKALCHNGLVIADQVGQGPKLIS